MTPDETTQPGGESGSLQTPPAPTPTPVAAPAPTPGPSPMPSAPPEPGPTPAPAPTPPPSPSPSPSPTPAPPPSPTPSPSPSPTPAPTPSPSPTPTPAPAAAQAPEIVELGKNLALAEAMKPLETPITDVYSTAPDKDDARRKLKESYAAAIAKDGPLDVKFGWARRSFERAARDMDRATSSGKSWLDEWLAYALGTDGPLKKLLDRRKELAAKVEPAMGDREKARGAAQARTKAWAARFADWSTPVDKITAQIGQYADKIDKLNADINNQVNRNAAMTTFWFEVAPKHLQLARDLPAEVQAVVDKVSAKLADYPDLQEQLKLGAKRSDGSLYLVGTADELEQKRAGALDEWKKGATAQADAEVAFKLQPDDAATLKQRWDKLKGDAWIAEAKALPEPPKN